MNARKMGSHVVWWSGRHRILENLGKDLGIFSKSRGWKGLLEVTLPTLPAQAGLPKGSSQMAFEYQQVVVPGASLGERFASRT